jgi:hypothetical protein
MAVTLIYHSWELLCFTNTSLVWLFTTLSYRSSLGFVIIDQYLTELRPWDLVNIIVICYTWHIFNLLRSWNFIFGTIVPYMRGWCLLTASWPMVISLKFAVGGISVLSSCHCEKCVWLKWKKLGWSMFQFSFTHFHLKHQCPVKFTIVP